MSKLIITTVGTSIISNECYPEEFKDEIGDLVDGKPLNSVKAIDGVTAKTS